MLYMRFASATLTQVNMSRSSLPPNTVVDYNAETQPEYFWYIFHRIAARLFGMESPILSREALCNDLGILVDKNSWPGLLKDG
jgi:hypothetical protein